MNAVNTIININSQGPIGLMELNSAREAKLEIIEVFPADPMRDDSNWRLFEGKLGNKEEEGEEEEDREWTDHENLFTLVMLPTDLQRAGDPGGG